MPTAICERRGASADVGVGVGVGVGLGAGASFAAGVATVGSRCSASRRQAASATNSNDAVVARILT